METEKYGNYGKKQYFILLVLSVVTALLLPVISSAVTTDLYIKHMPYSSWFSEPTIFIVGIICGFVSSAVLIFVAIRYRFKLCLPFVAVTILGNFFSLIAVFLINKANGLQLYSAYYFIFITLMWCAAAFLNLGIIKLSVKFLKKEIAVVLAALLGMLILIYLERIVSRMLILTFNQAPITYTGNGSTYIFSGLPGTLLYLLRNSLYSAAAYLIIRLFFAKNKREKLYKIAVAVKATVKKLWQSTAK